MIRKIPQSFYDSLEKDFKSSHLGEFKFDYNFLENIDYTDISLIFHLYYPSYVGKGMYKPFMEIAELREFGEQLIALQSSPLWKALK